MLKVFVTCITWHYTTVDTAAQAILTNSLNKTIFNMCTERSPKKSDEIRNQILHRYN